MLVSGPSTVGALQPKPTGIPSASACSTRVNAQRMPHSIRASSFTSAHMSSFSAMFKRIINRRSAV
ncbi:hypothetical protein D3C75_1180300 [compost metagenome]